jgi:Putative Actinobacterial Holin-X, holin superfamily III
MPEPTQPTSLPEQVSDIVATAKAYALQETVDPLRGVGRFVAFGLGGAIVGGIGLILLLLAGLRALQTETGSSMTGNLSWIPYVIVLIVTLALLGLFASRIGKHELAKPKSKGRPS